MNDKIIKTRFDLLPGVYRIWITDGIREANKVTLRCDATSQRGKVYHDIKLVFVLDSGRWLLEKLIKACQYKLDKLGQVHIRPFKGNTGLVDRNCFMAVREFIEIDNDGAVLNERNEFFDFMIDVGNDFPAMLGDPFTNEGLPLDQFRRIYEYSDSNANKPYGLDLMPIPIQL